MEDIQEMSSTNELIMLSSLLLRLGQTTCEPNSHHDYAMSIENIKGAFLLVDHDDEGFVYTISKSPEDIFGGDPLPLKNVSMLNSLLLYGYES